MQTLVLMAWPLAMILLPFTGHIDLLAEATSTSYVSVEEACKQKLVHAAWTGKGVHMGDCIKLELKNRTPDTVFLLIESGRRLVSQDTTLQDILIIEEEQLILAAGEHRVLSIFGFCCESNMSSPYDSSAFLAGTMADEKLVKLANYLDLHKDLPLSEMQDAVWAISNDHPVSGIWDSDNQALKDLKKFVADLKGVEVPWYSSEYKKDDQQLFTYETTTIQAEIQVTIPMNCLVTICIFNSDNQPVEIFEQDVPYLPGTWEYSFKVPVHGWRKGEYYFRIYGDGNLLVEKIFRI